MIDASLRAQATAGIAAGLAGAILIDAFLFAFAIATGTPAALVVAGTWTFVAAVLLGPSALSNPASPLIGALLHVAVSTMWAFGYVYLIRSQPQLLARPWISGAVFGIVVYVFMQIVLITAGVYHRPSPTSFESALVAHTLFYGIPVALIVSRLLPRTAAA